MNNPHPRDYKRRYHTRASVRRLAAKALIYKYRAEKAEKALIDFAAEVKRHNMAIEKAWKEGVAKAGM